MNWELEIAKIIRISRFEVESQSEKEQKKNNRPSLRNWKRSPIFVSFSFFGILINHIGCQKTFMVQS